MDLLKAKRIQSKRRDCSYYVFFALIWICILLPQAVSVFAEDGKNTRTRSSGDSNLFRVGQAKDSKTDPEFEKAVESMKRASNKDALLIVLDCSHSMKESLEHKQRKMDRALEIVRQIVKKTPPSVHLGLRTYGQVYIGDTRSDCEQSELLQPPKQNDKKHLLELLAGIQPAGVSPLEFAIRKAMLEDLIKYGGRKNIFLISDGADTCNGNACKFVEAVWVKGLITRIVCVNLSIRKNTFDSTARRTMKQLAKLTGGEYGTPDTSDALISSLVESYAPETK